MMSYDEILQRIEQAGQELVAPALYWAGQMFRIKKEQQQQRIHEIELEKHDKAVEAAAALTNAMLRHNPNLSPFEMGAGYIRHIDEMSSNTLKLNNKE